MLAIDQDVYESRRSARTFVAIDKRVVGDVLFRDQLRHTGPELIAVLMVIAGFELIPPPIGALRTR